MTNNSTLEPPASIPVHTVSAHDWVLIFAFLLIMCVGVIGNLLVCYVFGYKKRGRQSTTEWLILYLGVIDLLASLLNPPLFIYWILNNYAKWHFGYIGCKIIPAIGPIMTAASAGVLLIFAIDRYMAIVVPFRGQLSWKTITWACGINMLLSALSYMHYMVQLKLSPDGNYCYVPKIHELDYGVPNCVMILFRLFSFIIIFGFTNVRIFQTLRRNQRTVSVRQLHAQRHSQSKRIMKVLLAMGLVFFVLVFPRELFYLVYNMSLMVAPNMIEFNKDILIINSWLKIFHTANSCANVFVYAHMQTLYRRHIIKFLNFIGCKQFLADQLYDTQVTSASPLPTMHRNESTLSKRNNESFRSQGSQSSKRKQLSVSFKHSPVTSNDDNSRLLYDANGNEEVFFSRAEKFKNWSYDKTPPAFL